MLRRGKEKKPEPWGFVANAAIGSAFALVLTLVLLFAASVLLVSGRLPEGGMGAITLGAVFLASGAGASFAIWRNRSRTLFVGLAEGVMLYAITFTVGAFVEVPTLFGELSPLLFLSAILGGVSAGLFWLRPKKRKI